MKTFVPAAIAAALLVSLTPAPALPQKPLQFGSSAELVLIDLVATDGDGRRITDLRPEEVEIYEGGKRQRLEVLSFVGNPSGAGTAIPRVASSPAPASEAAASDRPAVQSAPSRLVVVVDQGAMPSELLVPVRAAIVSMVRENLDPDTELMLVTFNRGLQVRMPFTTDPARFIAALEALRPSASGAELAMSDLMEQVERMCDGTPNADKNAVGVARAFVDDVRQGLTNATEGIGALSRYLAPIPGRKHIVFYSAGYPMQPQSIAASVIEAMCGSGAAQGSGRSNLQAGPSEAHTALRVGTQVDAEGILRAMVDEANRSQVSVYTVDARGLMGDAVPGSQRVPSRLIRLGNAQAIQQRAVREPQEILYSIADGTGGSASINTNDMARGMQAAARDGRAYYLLGYAPPGGRKEGRYYPIEVKVTRPGLKLRYRRGYQWVNDQMRAERALTAALRFPELYAQEGLALDSWVEAGKLNVAVVIPTRILEFRSEGGQHLNDIAVQAMLRDANGKVVGDRYLFSKSVAMKLPEDRFADLRTRENVEIANVAEAPKKGRYQLTVVARHSGGRLASASADVEVP
jgi:VWFA-related protein